MAEETIWIWGSQKREIHCLVPVMWVLSAEDLPSEGCFALALSAAHFKSIKEAVVQIRQKNNYHLIPLFYLGTLPEGIVDLFDGPLDDSSLSVAREIHERIKLLPTQNFEKNA
jgi:hypothetical protein